MKAVGNRIRYETIISDADKAYGSAIQAIIRSVFCFIPYCIFRRIIIAEPINNVLSGDTILVETKKRTADKAELYEQPEDVQTSVNPNSFRTSGLYRYPAPELLHLPPVQERATDGKYFISEADSHLLSRKDFVGFPDKF